MRTLVPYLIVGFFIVFFIVLHAVRPLGGGKPGILRKIWRGVVHVWDFITGFG